MRTILQPLFILHSRAFNETSLLLDVFTQSQGRISLLAKGGRSRFRGLCRPFIPLLASWSGKTELMKLHALEAHGAPCYLVGMALLSGFYLNELLVRLLPRWDVHGDLFIAYHDTLQSLQSEFNSHHLRYFEKKLLGELGYGVTLDKEADTGSAIDPEASYYFFPQKGLVRNTQYSSELVFKGQNLLAFHHNALATAEDARAAKSIMRIAIASLLGEKPLKSRALFASF